MEAQETLKRRRLGDAYMDDEIIHYLRGSVRLSAIYEKWAKRSGFEGEYMDDLLAGDRLDAAQREWLADLEFHYLKALRREKRIAMMTSPIAMLFYFFVLAPLMLSFLISSITGGEEMVSNDVVYTVAVLMLGIGAATGYFAAPYVKRGF